MKSIVIVLVAFTALVAAQTYEPNWPSVNSRPLPSWYDQAKFGIFVHWGVFSVPGFADPDSGAEWYWYNWKTPSSDNGLTAAYHNRSYGPDFTYQSFAPMFTADLFNATEWAEIFYGAGAKYVVLTSKHHEGFTMWPSSQSWGWNAVDLGPKLDVVGLLTDAVKSTGIHMGLYHSLFEWFNPLYLADAASGSPPTSDIYVKDVLMPQLQDIVNKYEPSVIWADGDWDQLSEYWQSPQFLSWLYTNSSVKDVVVTNDRWGSECASTNGGYWTPSDRYNPGKLIGHKWENCMTIGNSWGINQNQPFSDYQTTPELVQILVSTVSCGGNLLLNVGPSSQGVIPMLLQERLAGMGEWLNVNGESIYNSTFWRVQNETVAETLWYTTNLESGAVYAITFEWPEDGVLELLSPVASKSTKVELLGYPEPIAFTPVTRGGMHIKLPTLTLAEYPPHQVYTFKLTNVK
eukprot:gene14165-16697_t